MSLPSVDVLLPSISALNIHPMVTKSKASIFKPKAFGFSKSKAAFIDYTVTEPPSYKIATQYQQWCSTIDEEFDALTR